MVSGGCRQGLHNVAARAQLMTGLTAPGAVSGALGRDQELRLGSAAQDVAVSERATAADLTHAGARPAR